MPDREVINAWRNLEEYLRSKDLYLAPADVINRFYPVLIAALLQDMLEAQSELDHVKAELESLTNQLSKMKMEQERNEI